MKNFAYLSAAIFFLTGSIIFVDKVHAQTITDLQAKIDQRNQDIANLDQQIQDYQKQINALGSQASSLSATIKSLDLTQKKLAADIRVTENKIAAKDLEIQQLQSRISVTEGSISDDQRIIRQTFKTIGESSGTSVPSLFLGSQSISQSLAELERLGNLQTMLYDRIDNLNTNRTTLVANKTANEKAQADLVALKNQLTDQKTVVASTASDQKNLLKQTNQSQTQYASILAEKKAEQAAFQQEIDQYQSQLHLLVNPSQIPHTGSGILSWPLDTVRITQYFGNTPFATANPQIYGGKGHDGVDFAATIGTPIKAALSGVVIGVANTDLYPGCYSFGKWIMIKHADGLSTLYAHLSLQSVAVGQSVTTGQVIGYSGNTGYTTGPHLHFGVYATAGTVIKLFTNSRHCQGATIPVADFSAYLNPLSYL